MPHETLVNAYLDALAAGDLEGVLELFTVDAVIHSPLYGDMAARQFYTALFADTQESTLALKATMAGEHNGQPIVAFWFDFDWILANGNPAPFTVVDVAHLHDDGRISELDIVYDTASLRSAFDEQHRVERL